MVLETCASESVADYTTGKGFATAGQALTVSSSGGTASWNVITAGGGEYRLCWCGGGQHCTMASDYAVDLGPLMLVGPNIKQQDRTCVAGQTCFLDSIGGQYLSTSDKMMIMETCGARMLHGTPSAGRALTVSASGSSFFWGNTALTAAGGKYQLCWCASGFACSVAEDFKVTVSTLTVVGPDSAPGLSTFARTCVAGQTCSIDGVVGHDLANSDSIYVFDTCGAWTPSLGFPAIGLATTSASGATLDWGAFVVSSNGGHYRLCWCAGGFACTAGSEFDMDVGSLTVVGPKHQGDRTCISGETCRIASILGQDLDAGDTWVVLDTCGSGSTAVTTRAVPRFPLAGLTLDVTTSGTSLSWGTAVLSASGGLYRLCWCAATYDCTNGEDMSFDVGGLHVIGITTGTHQYTCVAGQSCVLDGIVGYNLAATDRLMVLDTCSTPDSTAGFGGAGVALTIASSGASATFGGTSSTVSAAGGQYRLCWCGGATTTRCSTGDDFNVRRGRKAGLRSGRQCTGAGFP